MASRKKVPIRNLSSPDGEAIARAIANDLPGWDLVRKSNISDEAASQAVKSAQEGATIGDLRRKFLRIDTDAQSDGDYGPEHFGTFEPKRTTVLVEPKEGGPSKVADVKNGKATIVQG